MSRNEEMVRKMAQAGFKVLFLGIENVSKSNLKMAGKGDIVEASRRAMALCHKYGIMVVAGVMFGFPDDDGRGHRRELPLPESRSRPTRSYCQIVTPYPKTGMRQYLLDEGLVTNPDDFTRYNGMWANVRTRHLSADELQYLVWYHQRPGDGLVGAVGAGARAGPGVDGHLAFRLPAVSQDPPRAPAQEAGVARALRAAHPAHGAGRTASRTWMTFETAPQAVIQRPA